MPVQETESWSRHPSETGISDPDNFRISALIALSFALVLWLVKSVEWALGLSLAEYGILPRTLRGLPGIFTCPLLHGDLMHLLSNTMPLILLTTGLFYFYRRIALEVGLWIYFFSGFWVWLIGRDAYHIGASGLIYGLAAFLLFGGIFQRNRRLMAVSLIVLFLYGGLAYGLMPSASDPQISWESHLLGAIVGFILAIYFRREKTGPADREPGAEEKDEDSGERTGMPVFGSPTATISSDLRIHYKPNTKKQ